MASFCVDRFPGMARFVPTTTDVSAEETANLYLRHVFKHHSLPLRLRNSVLLPFFTPFSTYATSKAINLQLTIRIPHSDGQKERVNQVQEIPACISRLPPRRLDPLPFPHEITNNDAQHTSTKVSPFFASYGFYFVAPSRSRLPLRTPQPPARTPPLKRPSSSFQPSTNKSATT
jgi:hypothetical protein